MMSANRILATVFVVTVWGIAVALWPTSVRGQGSPTSRPASGPASRPASQPGKELALDLGNSVTMRLVLIPGGKFMMGSPDSEKGRDSDEGPQHEVAISKSFYLGIYAVTQGQWKAVMGTEPWKKEAGVREGVDFPVTFVSWDDAAEFCKRASQKAGMTVRLPTEAEREYACRAGTKTRFYYGDDLDYAKLGDNAWYIKNAPQAREGYAHAAGQKKPNDWGLYDMHGNVWGWCSDWYGEKYYANSDKTDPRGPGSGTLRVVRGGSWLSSPQDCRSALRHGYEPDVRTSVVGFRVCVDSK